MSDAPDSSNNNDHGSARSKPSPLRQRLGNLAPLDTSFEDATPNGIVSNVTGTMASPSPTPKASSTRNRFGNQSAMSSAWMDSPPRTNAADAAPSSANNDGNSAGVDTNESGIATLTASKRPGHKVGIIFTRQSRQSPDVAVISKVMPDGIFASHNARWMGRGGLEGAEVIAVNGVPVRDPRHGAELVAKAVEEVRLTVKRNGGRGVVVASEDERFGDGEEKEAKTKVGRGGSGADDGDVFEAAGSGKEQDDNLRQKNDIIHPSLSQDPALEEEVEDYRPQHQAPRLRGEFALLSKW